jgi:HEAT repeat protein
MCLVDVLSRLSKDAASATPAMIKLVGDEADGVRQIAITFFTQGEDEQALLNRMEPAAKRKLLPKFIQLMDDENSGVRNNVVIALRYYPEEAQVVTPALLKARLCSPCPRVGSRCAKENRS